MQVIMKGKLIPVFVLAALVSCSQPPVKDARVLVQLNWRTLLR